MIDAAFRRELARAVGPGGLLSDPTDLLTYESDALAHLRAVPGAVVLPASAAEVQAVVRLCHRSPACRSWRAATAPDSREARCRIPTAC